MPVLQQGMDDSLRCIQGMETSYRAWKDSEGTSTHETKGKARLSRPRAAGFQWHGLLGKAR